MNALQSKTGVPVAKTEVMLKKTKTSRNNVSFTFFLIFTPQFQVIRGTNFSENIFGIFP